MPSLEGFRIWGLGFVHLVAGSRAVMPSLGGFRIWGLGFVHLVAGSRAVMPKARVLKR